MAAGSRIKIVRVSPGLAQRSPAREPDVRGPASLSPAGGGALLAELMPLSVIPAGRRPAVYRGRGVSLVCDDGYSAVLGQDSALLTGFSSARDEILRAILLNRLSGAGSVLLLTGSESDSEVMRVARDTATQCSQSVRHIRNGGATPGFTPLAGWRERDVVDFFHRTVARAYTGQNAAPGDGVRMCFIEWRRLAEISQDARQLLQMGVSDIRDALLCCERAPLPREEQDRIACLMQNRQDDCRLAAQIIGDYLRAFEDVCVSGRERYNLFSPGLTALHLDSQRTQESASMMWYLCKMTGYLSGRMPDNVTVVVEENVDAQILAQFSSLLFDASVCLVAVCGNYTALGDESLRSRLSSRMKQQFVFRQQETDSAAHWSSLSGERKVLLASYAQGGSTTYSWLQPSTKSKSDTVTYSPTFRPTLEITHFTGMGDNEGELLEAGQAGSLFHHFSL